MRHKSNTWPSAASTTKNILPEWSARDQARTSRWCLCSFDTALQPSDLPSRRCCRDLVLLHETWYTSTHLIVFSRPNAAACVWRRSRLTQRLRFDMACVIQKGFLPNEACEQCALTGRLFPHWCVCASRAIPPVFRSEASVCSAERVCPLKVGWFLGVVVTKCARILGADTVRGMRVL